MRDDIQHFSVDFGSDKRLDVTLYIGKLTSRISMEVWTKGIYHTNVTSQHTYLNFEKFMPRKIGTKIAIYQLNKQSVKLTGRKFF